MVTTTSSEQEANTPEKVLEKYRDKIEYEETQAIIKMAWSYMVFSTSTKESDHISENKIIWEKLSKLINDKVSYSYFSINNNVLAFNLPCLSRIPAKVNRARPPESDELLYEVGIELWGLQTHKDPEHAPLLALQLQ